MILPKMHFGQVIGDNPIIDGDERGGRGRSGLHSGSVLDCGFVAPRLLYLKYSVPWASHTLTFRN